MNITGNELVSSQGENENFITIKHFQGEINDLRGEVGNKNDIIKTLLENINCLKKFFSQNQNSSYNSCQKTFKMTKSKY